MWILARFPFQVRSTNDLISSQYFQFSSNPISSRPRSRRVSIGKSRNAFRLDALETKREATEFGAAGPEIDGNVDVESAEDDFVPLKDMKMWLANKPRGFGEGKVYDTSIEDELLEEIEQSRKAAVIHLNKLNSDGAMKSIPKKEEEAIQVKGTTDNIREGCLVRLLNLPKKKNIHRDLQAAFNGFPGITDTSPVVSGNKKTRDPICKGVAFITFKSESDAQRFVQEYAGRRIVFGKIEKQIKCEVMRKDDAEDMNIVEEEEEEEEESTPNSSSEENHEKKVEPNMSGRRRRRRRISPKNNNISLGSANRLKTRERAMLTGVLSKYGGASTQRGP